MDANNWWDVAKTIISAAITACAGFGGVWYGQRNLARKDARQAEQEAQQAERERAFVASTAIEHLERFINGCSAVSYDDGYEFGQPARGDGYCQSTTTPPQFDPHALKLNWNALPPDLIYDILAIPSRQEHIDRYLSSDGFDDPPDHSDYFDNRRLLYARLGQQVTGIALRVRAAGGLPNETLIKGDWSRDDGFAEVIADIEKRQAQQAARHKEFMGTLMIADEPQVYPAPSGG